MNNLNLLRNSARQAGTNKIAWLCVLVTLIGQIVPALKPMESTSQGVSSAIPFLSAITAMILGSGLVYSVSQQELHGFGVSVLEGWRKGWSKLLQVAILTILLLVIAFVVLLLISLLLNKSIGYSPLTIAFALLARPGLIFGTCAIIINNGSIGASVSTSLSMFIRNLLQSLVIGGTFVIIQKLLLGIVILFIFVSPYRTLLNVAPTQNSLSFLGILDNPQVIFCDQVLALILFPWILITFTHFYLMNINTSQYKISLSQEAA